MSLIDRIRKPIHSDPAPHTRQFFDNLLVTTQGRVFAGFRMGDVRWDYTGTEAKARTLDQVQDGWALLEGTPYHERVTTRPHPVEHWAARLDARTPNPLPDVHLCERFKFSDEELSSGACGCYTWNAHLSAMQRRIAQTGQDDKVVFRYFLVGDVGGIDLRAEALGMRWDGKRPSDSARAVFQRAKEIADAVTGPGWEARRMTEREQEWLRHRSLGIALPAPRLTATGNVGWSGTDLPALATDIRWVEQPFDRNVRLVGWRDGKQIERVVQVLTLALDPGTLDYPNNGLEPWMVYAERAVDLDGRPIGAEWSVNGRIATGEELKAQAELDLRRSLHLEKDYRDFNEPPREDIARGIMRAKEVRDEVGKPARISARFVGTVNMVVWGETAYLDGKVVKTAEEVAEERAASMTRLYAGADMGFHFVTPHGQAAKLAEFVPGEYEVWDKVGYQRQWPLDFHSTALPNVSTSVGDGHGPYMGPTRGAAKRPTFHDSHYATEGRSTGRGQNMWLWISTLGGGKTVGCVGSVGYNAVRRGIRTLVSDPSGPTLALTRLPELAPYSNGFNLLKGEAGILNPPSLVRDPIREEFEVDDDGERRDPDEVDDHFSRARVLAMGRRESLVRDVARRMLEADLYDHPQTRRALRDAARGTVWTRERTMWDLVDRLLQGDEHSRDVGEVLRDASDLPRLNLLFAPRTEGGDFITSGLKRAVFTVVATPGVKRAPDSKARADWDQEELSADAVTYLTGLYTGREVYDKPMDERAVFIADEAETLTDGAMGNAFLSTLGRDHSKWNIEAHLLLKNLNEVVMQREILNFIAGVWIGRMAKLGPAEDLLDTLGSIDRGYAKSLLRLSERRPGEFVHVDADNRVGGMAVDLGYMPHVQRAIFTTPDPTGHGAWASSEEVLG
jgi:hypothetical protein